jgi:uncharacterized protein YhjY with autotransporter beta-barrel domain
LHAANELGQAVSDLGGDQLLVNAADAIYTTCVGLATFSGQLTPDQQALGGRCADMTQQGFQLAGQFDAAVPASDTFGLAGAADGTSSYLGLLRQFTGEEVSSQGRYATEGAVSQFKGLAGRLGAIRRGMRTSGFAVNLQGTEIYASSESTIAAPTLMAGGNASAENADTGFAWFANVEYGFGDRDDTTFEDGYDADSWGGVIGLDYGVNESLVVGGAFSYRTTDVEFDRRSSGSVDAVSGGDLQSDSQTLSLFANYLGGPGYASAIVSYGSSDYDMSRAAVIPIDTSGGLTGGLPAASAVLESDTDSDQFGAQLQAGRTFGQTATTYDLYGGLDYLDIDVDGFTETGSPLALAFGAQQIKSFQGFLGATVRHAINTDSGVLVPYLTVEYRHEFDNEGRVLDARYVGTVRAPGETFQGETDNFEILTDEADQDYFDTSVGLAMQFGNNLVLYGQFSTLLGVDDVSASLLTLGLRGSF